MTIISAYAFIDWDSARRIQRASWDTSQKGAGSVGDRALHIQECFTQLQTKVNAQLSKIAQGARVRVLGSRIYHGWHNGKTETLDRRAWETAMPRLRQIVTDKVSFLPDIQFGNILSCGGKRMPIFDTVRTREDGESEQKMVDTALVADLLSYCRTESRNFKRGEVPDVLAIVVGDDDDLLPGAFVSEQWGLPTYVFRVTRSSESKHNNTNGIIFQL